VAEFEVAIVRASATEASRAAAPHISDFCAEATAILIWRKPPTEALFFGRAAGTAIGFALGEDRDRGFVLEFPQEIGGHGLEKPAFDGALAPASSSQSLENPHRVSVDGGTDNAAQEQRDLCRGSNTPPNDGAICARQRASTGSV
jgi:hypothetical protein